MIHPDTELRFISEEKGYGVVATKLIPKGTITWVLDALDRVYTPKELEAFPDAYKPILEKYCFRDKNGNWVLCWDNARFVNHSFNSSCMATAYNLEIAVRDIQPSEELTDDYGYLNLAEPFVAMPEEGSIRSTVYPDDPIHFHTIWDSNAASAFKLLNTVPQALAKFLNEADYRRAVDVAAGAAEMRSVLEIYYRDNTQAAREKNR